MTTADEDLRCALAVLAERLLEYAGAQVEVMPAIEGDDGRVVMVHTESCGGSCDYGCGAVAITYTLDEDGAVTVGSVEVVTTVHDRGMVDTIRVAIPAVVFGRWAAHPSVDYMPGAALAVDGGADLEAIRIGWVVTHVATGYTIPASILDGLTQDEAEAIACALEDVGPCVCDLDLAELHAAEGAIAQVVYGVLDGLAEIEGYLEKTDAPLADLGELLAPRDILRRAADRIEREGGDMLDVIEDIGGDAAYEATLRLATWLHLTPMSISAWQRAQTRASVVAVLRGAAS